jgi:membrane-associated protease RseP (regulator of RpoE activity)
MAVVPLLVSAGASADTRGHWRFDPLSFPHRGRIGVHIEEMTPELRAYFRAPEDRGVLVVRVEPDRPAARAGMRVGDVIVSAAGESVEKPFDLIRTVAAAPAGEAIELGVLRDGKERAMLIEPEGEPSFWADPERLGTWFEERLHGSCQDFRERIERLERRIDELERKLEERDRGAGEAARET